MSANLYNAEGYLDTTAYVALTNVEQEAKRGAYRPLVFICSPYAGDREKNSERARAFCRFAVSEHCIPIAPHLLFPQFMDEDDPAQRRLGIFFGLVLQSKCREVWAFGGRITKGMAVELAKARERGLTIRYFKRVPGKPAGFSGEGNTTEQADFRIYTEVSAAEFVLAREEVIRK